MKIKLIIALPILAMLLSACEDKKAYDRVASAAPDPANTEIKRGADGMPIGAPSGFAVIFNLETAVPEIPIVSDFLTAYPTQADGKVAINKDDADGTLYMECQDTRQANTYINCSSVFAQQMKQTNQDDKTGKRILADDGQTKVNFLLDANGAPQTSTPIMLNGVEVFPGYNPVYSAIDDLDGFSTIAPFDVPLTRPIDASTLAGNWYIVPVNYGTQSPKTGEPNRNDPLAKPNKPIKVQASVVSHSSFGSIKNNVLRFTPISPLEADTRYLLVLTTGIKDTTGQSLALPEGYAFLNSNKPFPPGSNPAAQAARSAVKDWMLLATALMLDKGRSLSNISMSYTFVTGGKATVMQAISNPSTLVSHLDKLPDSAPKARPVDFASSKVLKLKEIKKFKQAGYQAAFTTGSIELPYYLQMPKNANSNVENGEDQFYEDNNDGRNNGYASCVEEETKQRPVGKLIPKWHGTGKILNPHCRQSELSAANILLSEWQADDSLRFFNPRKDPKDKDGKPVSRKVTNFFPFPKEYSANGKVLKRNSNLQVVIPQGACSKPATGWKTVIYQHDLFESRMHDNSMKFAEKMAANCIATLAIDLPLHGLMPNVSSGEALLGNDIPLLAYSNWSKTGLKVGNFGSALGGFFGIRDSFLGKFAGDMSKKSSENEGIKLLTRRATEERYFGLTKEPNMGEIGYEDKKWNTTIGFKVKVKDEDYQFPNFVPQAASQEYGTSGSLFLNFLHFQTLRDNMRQAVLDLLNLNASIASIDYDNDGQADFDASSLQFVGKGMGAIIGSEFVALNNASSELPTIKKVALIDVLGGLGAWLRTSPLGKDMVDFYSKLEPVLDDINCKKDCVASLKTKPNAVKDSTDYNTLMYMFQASLDSVDPLNYVDLIKANLNALKLYKSDNPNYPAANAEFGFTGTDEFAKRLGKVAPKAKSIEEIRTEVVDYLTN